MPKTNFKPGNMLYPVPAVLVSCGDINNFSNIITVAWTGTICTNPPMLYISVRPERFSYDIIKKTGEFVINLTTEKLAYATDFCGVRSGRDTDKELLINNYLQNIPSCAILSSNISNCIGGKNGYTC